MAVTHPKGPLSEAQHRKAYRWWAWVEQMKP